LRKGFRRSFQKTAVRERLDHLVVYGEAHLRRVLAHYVGWSGAGAVAASG
jgi:hypothetical protein